MIHVCRECDALWLARDDVAYSEFSETPRLGAFSDYGSFLKRSGIPDTKAGLSEIKVLEDEA